MPSVRSMAQPVLQLVLTCGRPAVSAALALRLAVDGGRRLAAALTAGTEPFRRGRTPVE